MGFSTAAAQTILFIAVIILSTGLVMVYKNVVDTTASSLQFQSNLLSNKVKTDITITNVYYNNNTDTIVIDVKNLGKTKLDLDLIDVFIDSERIPRQTSNRTIEVLSDTEIVNPGIWDPKEDIEIKVFKILNQSISHTVKVTTQYGISDIDSFS